MPDSAARTIFNRLWARLLASAGVLAAMGVVWYNRVEAVREAPPLPVIAVGQPVQTGPYALTLIGAERAAAMPDGMAPLDGVPRVLVHARVENLTSRTRGDVDWLLAGPGRAEMYLTRDATRLTQLQPALPEEVVFAFPDPGGEALALQVVARSYKARDNLSGAAGWFGATPVGQAELPIEAAP